MRPPALDPLATLRAALAPHYEVERAVGAGGMGSVYLGRDTTLDRPVAIKVISAELSASALFRERFLHEARTVARLRHPNIVAVFAAGERDGLLWYVMEYVPGETLREVLDRERRLTPERAAGVLRDILGALAYAHEHGVVHRDLKPENILLDAETGRAMLADFGVAKSLAAGDGSRTGTGIVVGSPRYMSPEQAAGERTLDGRSDLYALGLVGYELVAGESAFGTASGATLLAKQITETPPSLASKAPDAPPGLVAAIDRALAKSPDERWPDAAAMRRALDEDAALVAPGGPEGATTAGRTPAAAARRRTRFRLAAAMLGVVLLAIPALWFTVGRRGVPAGVDPRKSFLVAPFEIQTGDPQLGWLRDGSVNMLTSNLALWSDLTVVDYERTLDMLRAAKLDDERVGLETGRELARDAGAWTLVLGQVTRAADSVVVVARAYDVASGRRLREAQRSAPIAADPRALFDGIARDLLDLAGAPPMTPDVARRTTSSLVAYRAYVDGVRHLNSWRLAEAEESLGRATAADSTFALAYYKHALAIGWRRPADTTQIVAVAHARRHAGRLAPRDRDLVEAYHYMVQGLRATGDDATRAAHLAEAQRRYQRLVQQDSTDAEAWYGLGDAYYHGVSLGDPQLSTYWTRALRAFDRTTRLDSSFHLAYAHKVNIYQAASRPNTGVVVEADSVITLRGDSAVEAFGRERRDRALADARRRVIAEARHWVDADPEGSQAWYYLASSYIATGHPDSAARVMREGFERTKSMFPEHYFQLAIWQAMAEDTSARGTMRAALARVTADTLRARSGIGRTQALGGAAGAASYFGDLASADSALMLLAATEPPPRQLKGVTWRQAFGLLGTTLRAAAGADLERTRREIDAGLAGIDRVPDPLGREIRGQVIHVPYVAYLVWREPKYLATTVRYNDDARDSFPELQGLAALRAGDTTRARRLAGTLPAIDTSRMMPLAGMRRIAMAELYEELGDARTALAWYESIRPRKFNTTMAAPGWPLLARSYPARARLHEQLGEREKAIAAYERFLALWADADPALEPQVRAARAELAALRDAPRRQVAR